MPAGNTTFYIVAFIIIAHFIVGFIFLVRKLSGPVEENSEVESLPACADASADRPGRAAAKTGGNSEVNPGKQGEEVAENKTDS